MHRGIKGIIIAASCVVIIAVFLSVTHINDIKIKGNSNCSEQELKQTYAGNFFTANAVILLLREKVFGLPEHPMVQEADIKWKGIRNVEIQVYEKTFVGCLAYMNYYVYFDRDGIVLKSSDELLEGVPCITGIDFGTFTLYEPLDIQEPEIFNRIMNITQLINHLQLTVDKLHVDSAGAVTLKTGDITVKLGKREMYDEPINALASVLAQMEEGKNKGTIDMRNYSMGDRIILDTN